MKKKSNKSPKSSAPETRKVSPEDERQLRALEHEVTQAKIQLADLVLQQRAAEHAVALSIERYKDKVFAIARSQGIDPDDASKARWDFNADTMLFVRTS
jgi:hypothetical protein